MQIQECQGFELHILHLEYFSLLLQILSGIVFVRDIVPISSPTQRNPQNPTPYSNPLTQYMAFPSDSFSTWLLKGKLYCKFLGNHLWKFLNIISGHCLVPKSDSLF